MTNTTTTSNKEFYNSNYTGVAYINNIVVRSGRDGSDFYSIELAVKSGEKSSNKFETSRLSAVATSKQAKLMCEAITGKVDFTKKVTQSEETPEAKTVISCAFKVSGIKADHYHVGNDVYSYLTGRCMKLDHVYINGELLSLGSENSEAAALAIAEDIRISVEAFMESIIDLDDIELDGDDPLLSHYVEALVTAGYHSQGDIFNWATTAK